MVLMDDGYPSLTAKAFNGRLFVVFLTTCLEALAARNPDLEIRLALTACKAMCMLFDRMERAPRYLNARQAAEIYKAGLMFMAAYDKLARLNSVRRVQRFKLLPKLHVLFHLVQDMYHTQYNARAYHCFKDEDNVGLLKRLAVRVHKGPLMEYRILTRWLLRLQAWTPGTGS